MRGQIIQLLSGIEILYVIILVFIFAMTGWNVIHLEFLILLGNLNILLVMSALIYADIQNIPRTPSIVGEI